MWAHTEPRSVTYLSTFDSLERDTIG
jgi:hypothetical protein